jgi:hypothetical protein
MVPWERLAGLLMISMDGIWCCLQLGVSCLLWFINLRQVPPTISRCTAVVCSLDARTISFRSIGDGSLRALMIQSGYVTSDTSQADVRIVYSIFSSWFARDGWERLWSRSSGLAEKMLSFWARWCFSLIYSSTLYLGSCQPTQLPAEPLAIRLATLQKSPEECDCRFFESEFSPDPLAGSFRILVLREYGVSEVYLLCVLLGPRLWSRLATARPCDVVFWTLM